MGKGKQHAVAAARVGSDKKEEWLLCRGLMVWYNDKKSAFGYVDTVDLGYAEYGLDRFRLYQYLL